MKIAISAESTIDIQSDLIKAFDFKVIPYGLTLGEKEYLDGEITSQDIFNYVDKTGKLPRTSAINDYQYQEFFQSVLDQGYEAVIHFGLSSALSTSYQNACRASQHFNNVYIIDTRSLSTGIALLACYAYKLVKRGKTPLEICKMVNDRVPYVQASFVLDKLDYLHKGGRCSSLQRFGANLLHIRPQIIVDNGRMISGRKYRGKDEEVVKKYCEDTLALFNTPDTRLAFVTCTNYSENIIKIAHDCLVAKGFKTIIHSRANATVTSHCGDKCIGILYINDGDKDREF